MKITFPHNLNMNALLLSRMCGGALRAERGGEIEIRGICTDSREADADTAFVALRGERVDGHDFIETVLKNGCRCVICEHSTQELEASGAAAIVTGDSELSLSRLANAYRKTLNTKTVGITGSVGKTTTKEMIAAVLAREKNVYKSKGNFNSVIGMPLSLMETPSECDVSILEMGMSAFGEIERMSITAQPDIAVITNIGSSHMEMLGSRENICRAKLEILCGLADGGTLILNGDEELLANVGGKSYRTMYVSLLRQDADFFAQNIRMDADSTTFDVVYRGKTYEDMRLRLMGRHNVYAALYAFAVGILSGLTPEDVRAGLLDFETAGMRQNRYSHKNITIIEDCYNASPESMIAAIDVLAAYTEKAGGRSVAVLGDMLELGSGSSAAHRRVGLHLAKQKIDKLFTLGHDGMQIATGAMQGGMKITDITSEAERAQMQKLSQRLLSELRAGDVVLFKASRSVSLEKMIGFLKENY